MLAVIGDVVWQALIAAVLAIVLALINVWSALVTKKAVEEGTAKAHKAAEAAAHEAKDVKSMASVAAGKAEEVKASLQSTTAATDAKLEGLAKVADATHVLVNNQHQIALQAVAELSRWKAGQTKHPDDEAAADQAESALDAHRGKQSKVDSRDA